MLLIIMEWELLLNLNNLYMVKKVLSFKTFFIEIRGLSLFLLIYLVSENIGC